MPKLQNRVRAPPFRVLLVDTPTLSAATERFSVSPIRDERQGEDEIGSSAGGCSGLIGQVFYNPIRNQGGQNPEQTAWQHNDSKRNDNG